MPHADPCCADARAHGPPNPCLRRSRLARGDARRVCGVSEAPNSTRAASLPLNRSTSKSKAAVAGSVRRRRLMEARRRAPTAGIDLHGRATPPNSRADPEREGALQDRARHRPTRFGNPLLLTEGRNHSAEPSRSVPSVSHRHA